ncbi:MAG: hypothetical protein QNJ63_05530 [Calothrix sp. MO_192.B10]|nr:hypothetical protein [Calothrix sp. MO_192.B10]
MVTPIDDIYDKINGLFGGKDPNQILCMLIPGTPLGDGEYYDTSQGGEVAKARADVLVDNLYDICQITGSDNNKKLSYQYGSALNVLIPKLDPELEKRKAELRGFLQSPYKGEMMDAEGNPIKGSYEDVFYSLQKDLVTAQEQWEKEQQEKKDELKTKYPNDIKQVNNEYEEWYQQVAKGRKLEINDKRDRCLAVFSDNEMNIINAILNSGTGAEIEGYRTELKNAGKESSVSYRTIYPVDLIPNTWTQALATNFNFVDLLSSPDFILQELENTQSQLSQEMGNLDFLDSNEAGDIQQAAKAYQEAQDNYNTAQSDLTKTLSKNSIAALKIYFANRQPKTAEEDKQASGQQFQEVTKLAEEIESGQTDQEKQDPGSEKLGPIRQEDWDTIQKGQLDLIDKQQNLTKTAQAVADASLDYIKAKGTHTQTGRIASKINELNQKVDKLNRELMAASKNYDQGSQSGNLTSYDDSGLFDTVTIDFSSSSLEEKSNLAASASQTSWNVDLFLGSAGGSTSDSSSDFTQSHISKDENIQIGFLATKVTIERGWFEPGIFNLTKDMESVSEQKISLGSPSQQDLQNPDTLNKYNDAIFPAYPVAFIIAKDISIKFKINQSSVAAANKMIQHQSNVGGGFLCFSASHSESSDQESKSLSSNVMGENVMIRLPGSQIIGWYLEYTPKDNTTHTSSKDNDTTNQFISAFKSVSSS